MGRGPLLTSPRHRHTNSTQTGRCPQPDSQPATQTNELHGKDACAPQTSGRGDQGTSTHPHQLIPAQPDPCPTPPHTHFGLAHWGWGLGSGPVEGGREEGVRAQLCPFCESREAGTESPGLSQGLAVG